MPDFREALRLKNSLTALVWVLLMLLFSQGRGKDMALGPCHWYTEQNAFADIAAVARSENKPILAVFSAKWSEPSQRVTKTLLLDEAFRKVSDRVVLLYIEETEKQGRDYVRRFGVRTFPTFKLISPEEVELESDPPCQSVAGLNAWITEVVRQNTLLARQTKRK